MSRSRRTKVPAEEKLRLVLAVLAGEMSGAEAAHSRPTYNPPPSKSCQLLDSIHSAGRPIGIDSNFLQAPRLHVRQRRRLRVCGYDLMATMTTCQHPLDQRCDAVAALSAAFGSDAP